MKILHAVFAGLWLLLVCQARANRFRRNSPAADRVAAVLGDKDAASRAINGPAAEAFSTAITMHAAHKAETKMHAEIAAGIASLKDQVTNMKDAAEQLAPAPAAAAASPAGPTADKGRYSEKLYAKDWHEEWKHGDFPSYTRTHTRGDLLKHFMDSQSDGKPSPAGEAVRLASDDAESNGETADQKQVQKTEADANAKKTEETDETAEQQKSTGNAYKDQNGLAAADAKSNRDVAAVDKQLGSEGGQSKSAKDSNSSGEEADLKRSGYYESNNPLVEADKRADTAVKSVDSK
eukprot:gnl/TRDRNA2_/TRDRNA2_190212_c0_seq1.p1 gnl/TRDRNA2_/TRDRNA2_190212_c0~~gnl/TRDRNA2_/TRDRNA2_190212_c0_seq1.p1  ORF type:complete len:292 (+),score=70.62 gnl/TRDRNA2_/TRDRNA2_190212_c0_seq1:34-909(+)